MLIALSYQIFVCSDPLPIFPIPLLKGKGCGLICRSAVTQLQVRNNSSKWDCGKKKEKRKRKRYTTQRIVIPKELKNSALGELKQIVGQQH